MKAKYRELSIMAQKARMNAYAPYSKFKVGAALLTSEQKIITGCNIENSSYGLTICAERVAIFKAISMGITKFEAIAVVSDDKDFTPPCGACRQVLLDLAGNIDFIMMNSSGKIKVLKLKSLLPHAFSINNLKK